ncbi:MAG: hypothetical protein IKT62_04735, partial [Firmicutes bacterium]|nr:hypothetical protein [Bacillota bacterium]
MKIALIYFGMAAAGYIAAIPLKKYQNKFAWMWKFLTFVVFSLVFSMGYKIGSNQSVINDIGTIGIYSLILAIA